jgi:hypothetical protein
MPCLLARMASTCSAVKARSRNLGRSLASTDQREKSNGAIDNEANPRLAIKVVLAEGQERAGVETGLFRLPQTIASPPPAVNRRPPTPPLVAAATTMGKHRPAPMRLANPTPIRLSQAQLDWLDAWRGNTMSRSSAIRLLLERVMREQQAATK